MLRTTGRIRTIIKLLTVAAVALVCLFFVLCPEDETVQITKDASAPAADDGQGSQPVISDEAQVFEPVFEVDEIPEDIRLKMTDVTISAGSKMTFDSLSYLSMTYVGYDGKEYIGHMVVDSALANEVICIFKELYEVRFPIERMNLAFEYGGSDELSMQDNNTSAFNDRPITGGSGLSYHQLGRAIDINPLVNPYVKGDVVLPAGSDNYLDREEDCTGMITADSECVRIFKKYGWTWGGDWTSLKDYQHFEKR